MAAAVDQLVVTHVINQRPAQLGGGVAKDPGHGSLESCIFWRTKDLKYFCFERLVGRIPQFIFLLSQQRLHCLLNFFWEDGGKSLKFSILSLDGGCLHF